jgi:hypothetical protein
MGTALTFLTSKLGGPVFGAAAITLLVLWLSAIWHARDLKSQLDDARGALTITQQTLSRQSESLYQLGAKGLEKQAAVLAALQGLQPALDQARARADMVLNADPKTCADYDALILGTIK